MNHPLAFSPFSILRSVARTLFVSCSASALAGAWCVSALLASPQAAQAAGVEADRVLLISIDGMHELDLTNYIAAHPTSTMARLVNTGITTPTPPAPSRPIPFRGCSRW